MPPPPSTTSSFRPNSESSIRSPRSISSEAPCSEAASRSAPVSSKDSPKYTPEPLGTVSGGRVPPWNGIAMTRDEPISTPVGSLCSSSSCSTSVSQAYRFPAAA